MPDLNPIAQYGELSFVENTIESTSGNIDIQIGLVGSTANLVLNRDTVTAAGKTFGLEDATSGQIATLSSNDGKVIIAGAAAGLIVGNIDIFQNTIESTSGNTDLIIGNTSSTANLILSRNTVTSAGKTFGLEDVSDNQVATLSAVNGYVVIAGKAGGLIVGNVEIFQNTVESTAGNIDLVIGNTVATANLVLSRNTVMTNTKTFTSAGNVALSGANVSLGAVGNLKITGGTSGQALTTDGSGNLSWTSVISSNTVPTYGQFWSNVTQTVAATNTEYRFTFNNSDGRNNVQLGTGASNSRVIINTIGLYNIQFSAQVDKLSGGGYNTGIIWFKKNGTAIPDTAGFFSVDQTQQEVQSWNILANVTAAGDYYELAYSADATTIRFPTLAGNPTVGYPASPSIIVTVTPL